MNLQLANKTYVVCGATSGFGLSTATALVNEGANVIAIARGADKLEALVKKYPQQLQALCGDITLPETLKHLLKLTSGIDISGILVNAGGPPAMQFNETTINDWDNAYNNLVRWKVDLTLQYLPVFIKQGHGKFLFVESVSVKQPVENLVLSTSMRMAVVGFVKTITQEHPDSGVHLNILAPGFHKTAAVDRLMHKKAEQQKITYEQAVENLEKGLPMKTSGNPDDFGQIAAFYFSAFTNYINGQVIPVDGGLIKASLG